MANHSSAKKAIRQIATRTEQNRDRVSRIRTFIKKVETLIEAGNQRKLSRALEAESEIMRGVSRGYNA